MRVFPAIDLRGGACVQLVGGAPDAEKIRLPDAAEVANRWKAAGFKVLHLVDLDAALGTGSNAAVIAQILKTSGLEAEVGGGVRDAESIQRLLDLGANRVIVGTRALEDPRWLEEMAFQFPGKLILAADARGRQVVTRGWTRTLSQDVGALVAGVDPLPLAAIMVTAVHVEGLEGGTDLALMSELVETTSHPLQASGGIASIDELRKLASAGVAAAILGMALYTGKIDARAAAKEFP
ncbi:MAG TPA: 1-(5-phosphoribosyl)-5-[(5-phosphoribosylamino)methylideneamino] imidazole-4-carboxamide isomerase [Gemmatimonadales bacterium]|jgi:phosphoribosylformimino-5-aminoimidazole carboxamide ribotide isomerase|nr:1-(5-phosphoribosyl)-5-[(5-phosphoribosylamino)methylideneamino] imidazole-4-carboxamide isomerase [Gemmatimonadales bacterium]